MAKASPEKSCNDTVLKYTISIQDLEAAKKQVVRLVGNHPVVFLEKPLPNQQLELMVMASSLTPSQKNELEELQQDGVMVKRIAQANFAVNQVSFGVPNSEQD